MMYKLDGKVAVKCEDQNDWASWFSKTDRTVANDVIGDSRISTVFLGFDHSLKTDPWFEGEPILFETMVFGGELDGEQVRCSTWEQAEEMHKHMCEQVKKAS